jgi:transcriptional regulator EpsA
MALSSRDEAYLVSVVEVARPIIRRHQFFLWARGVLQSLVPHEILICGYGEWRRRSPIVADYFAARPFPERMINELCDSDDGLLMQANAVWDGAGHNPLLVSGCGSQTENFAQFGEILQRHQIENCVLHGLPQINGAHSAFYCFAGLPAPLNRRTAYLIDLIMPSLHAAHLRVMRGEKQRDQRKTAPPPMRPRATTLSKSISITQREVQILQWVQEGKSNREIGEVLQISPLTVKNHVQNILKKLKVRNRAQAVSRAINARLIQSAAVGKSPGTVVRTAHSSNES